MCFGRCGDEGGHGWGGGVVHVFLNSVIEFHLIGRFVANVKVVGMDIISSYVRKIVLMT